MKQYEVYKNNQRTGDKKMLGTYRASSTKQALEKYFQESGVRSKKGKYLVLPWKIRANYTFVK